jgi:hypothetical protein
MENAIAASDETPVRVMPISAERLLDAKRRAVAVTTTMRAMMDVRSSIRVKPEEVSGVPASHGSFAGASRFRIDLRDRGGADLRSDLQEQSGGVGVA